MAIEKDLLDQLLAGRDPKDVFNKDGLVDELKKALSERILNTELDEHLDGEGTKGRGHHRNGYSKKSVLTGTSKMTLSVPRDRIARDGIRFQWSHSLNVLQGDDAERLHRVTVQGTVFNSPPVCGVGQSPGDGFPVFEQGDPQRDSRLLAHPALKALEPFRP